MGKTNKKHSRSNFGGGGGGTGARLLRPPPPSKSATVLKHVHSSSILILARCMSKTSKETRISLIYTKNRCRDTHHASYPHTQVSTRIVLIWHHSRRNELLTYLHAAINGQFSSHLLSLISIVPITGQVWRSLSQLHHNPLFVWWEGN